MKTSKRIFTFAFALMLVFALAAPCFALQTTGYVPVENGTSRFTVSSTTPFEQDGAFTVYLHLYSGTYNSVGPIDRTIAVSMGSTGATGQLYTVEDVLVAAEAANTELDFDIISSDPYHPDAYLQKVKDTSVNTNTWFEALPLKKTGSSYTYYCGWMFRINGMLPYLPAVGNQEPKACLIDEAYVTADDVIDLYYANVYKQADATKVTKVVLVSNFYNVQTFKVLEAECYMGTNDVYWTTTNWKKVTGSIDIEIDGVVQTVSLNNGMFVKTNLSGIHTLKPVTATQDYYVSYDNTITYSVPLNAGLYSRFVF